MSGSIEVVPPHRGDTGFIGDLDVSQTLVTARRALLWAPLTPGIRSAAGSASVGVLATLVDVITSMPAIASSDGDWTATQSLGLHAIGWLVDGPIVVDASLIRVGTKVVVVAADLWDAHGLDDDEALLDAFEARSGGAGHRVSPTTGPTLAGRSLITFARLPRASGGDFAAAYDPLSLMGKVVRRHFGPIPADPIWDRVGIEVVDASRGVLEIERVPYITNSIGTINGGALAIAIERAAELMRPGHVATDLQIQYLSQMRAGPARTRGTVSRDTGDHSVATIEVLDHGADDQVLALATVTMQQCPVPV
jgi:acyl-coenzyme A thioesterase PaaI-like protein